MAIPITVSNTKNTFQRLTLLTCFVISTLVMQAPLQAAPKPQSKSQALEAAQSTLKSEEARQKDIEKEIKEIESELSTTRKKLVAKAREVQNSENTLKSLEDRIAALEHDKKKTKQNIKKDQAAIGKLVMALERLKRLPPEVIIAKPDAPINTARSARLITEIVPVLNHRAKALREDIERLQNTREELIEKRKKASTHAQKLNKQYSKMTALMSTRENLYKRTQRDFEAQNKKVGKIAKGAKNLKDLVTKLDEDKARTRTRNLTAKALTKTPKPATSQNRNKKPPPQGSSRLPVSGLILVQYGDPDDFGAKSKGLKIEGRSQALVVAPMGGTIRYTGNFKNYGNLIIIEHTKGYHSLVAGLKKIDTVVGQNVTAGEPIGKLPRAGRSEKPILYYELRYKGNAVNPAKKFTELS